ncbi:hypothetical protein MVES1_002705 [Malassezia vespertilionis]|uniref:Uncharacterized protein n=1 Tax=Malassezia vespertilionis TaxID=2020962 RepID=A0A2N1JAZ0_9BASI|nr:uncharacterized protein MVES1_002705 [Malassezia vespertilionis]PKI83714.1 hypothetical protein MVES_002556 [Malassezia vespertilionis]WFD07342.1 hypothetical protein MVES1_002705 [Malassezia vespertilionis]
MPSHCTQKTLLVLVALGSIATGLFVSYMAIHAPNKPQFADYFTASVDKLRSHFGFVPHERILPAHWPYAHDIEQAYMSIVRVFVDLVESRFGKGAFLLIFSMVAPCSGFATTEAVKPHRHAFMSAIAITIIFSLGQLICIGAALPIFYIPGYALVRAFRPKEVFPQRPFSASALPLLHLMPLLMGLPTLLCVFVPVDHPYYFYANSAFQFFPLALSALVVYGLFARDTPTLRSTDLAAMYRQGALASTALYWASLYLLLPTLRDLYEHKPVYINDAIQLILWDAVGVLATLVFIVLIDTIADPVPAGVVQRPNLHGCKTSRILKTVGIASIFGPGAAMQLYFANREEAVSEHNAMLVKLKKQ